MKVNVLKSSRVEDKEGKVFYKNVIDLIDSCIANGSEALLNFSDKPLVVGKEYQARLRVDKDMKTIKVSVGEQIK